MAALLLVNWVKGREKWGVLFHGTMKREPVGEWRFTLANLGERPSPVKWVKIDVRGKGVVEKESQGKVLAPKHA